MIESPLYAGYYWVLVVGGVLIPSIVFLFLGYDAAKAVTSETKGQVANVRIAFLTVDGVLLGLSFAILTERSTNGLDCNGENQLIVPRCMWEKVTTNVKSWD